MRILSTLIFTTLLLCWVDAQEFQFLAQFLLFEPKLNLNNFLKTILDPFHQSDNNNFNKGRFPDVCPKHCNCYKYQRDSNYAKVKCFKRGLNQLPDWEIYPRILLV